MEKKLRHEEVLLLPKVQKFSQRQSSELNPDKCLLTVDLQSTRAYSDQAERCVSAPYTSSRGPGRVHPFGKAIHSEDEVL